MRVQILAVIALAVTLAVNYLPTLGPSPGADSFGCLCPRGLPDVFWAVARGR